MCLVFDYMCFYPCAHSSSKMAEKILFPCGASQGREYEFWAVQQFLSRLCIVAFFQDGGMVANHSSPCLVLMWAIFPGKLGICLQELQELHYRKSFKMLWCLECFVLFIWIKKEKKQFKPFHPTLTKGSSVLWPKRGMIQNKLTASSTPIF